MQDRLLKTPETATRLGVAPKTVRKWHYDGRLKGVKLSGKALRFSERDIEAFIEARRTK